MAYTTDIRSEDLSEARVNPQKRNILINRLANAPWWLLVILLGILLFAITVYDDASYQNAWEEVQEGLIVTIRVTIVAYSIALVFGLILALLRRPSYSLVWTLCVYQPATIIVELIRGIPTLVLLLYIVFGLVPELIGVGNDLGARLLENNIDPLGLSTYIAELKNRDVSLEYKAMAALSLSYGAFLSEVFRAGIDSIDRGQIEAAKSLGMSGRQVMMLVTLPQAIRNVLPPLGNDFIAMLKESSLVSAVGVSDITRQARDYNSATFTVFPGYNTIAATYLVLTLTLSMVVKGMEYFLNRSRRDNR